jgi:3-oxoacyl-[acyl-carrier protein] reductase
MPVTASARRTVALVTGASRRRGIAAAIALGLAAAGWDVATTFWRAYDATMPWGSDAQDVEQLDRQLRAWRRDRSGRGRPSRYHHAAPGL